MMRQNRHWLTRALLGVLSTCAMLAAQDTAKLTLSRAIERALKQNLDLVGQQDRVLLADLSARQSKNNLLPSLSLSGNAQRQFAPADAAGNGDSNSVSFNLGADFNLFNGFADRAAIRSSELDALMARKELTHTERTILFDTASSFLKAVITQSFIAVEEENLKAQQAQLQLIDDFVSAGKRPRADLFQQKADMAASELRLLDARRADHIQKLQLMQVIGETPEGKLFVEDPDMDPTIEGLKLSDFGQSLELAYQNRADLQAQDLAIRSARTGIQSARAGYLPKVSLFANLGGSYNSARSTDTLTRQLFDRNMSASAGLSVSVPVFDRLKTAAAVASARIELHSTEVQRNRLRQQIAVEVQQAREDFRSAHQEITSSQSQLDYSQQALESIQARYRVNAATMAELIQSRAQMINARYSLISARFTLMIRALNLAYVSGNDTLMKNMRSIK